MESNNLENKACYMLQQVKLTCKIFLFLYTLLMG